ncbi:carbohydrate binding family 9 domain-containing protein [Muricauda sp. 2012CJ35-5]|uniref:Carbohydrate binding family 9 domain-containing protein n=1 Tax=Flagellimonas spongiicola TaxID=2942208 RepID=A0ABT0PQY8_9FLAO|nr:DUF5916 domain-containing protein [Allomuricauda spongiicola]MCL6273769.1 carbohydrate binding family 9 domain-containing protein [Allomuricauda spongiicola]
MNVKMGVTRLIVVLSIAMLVPFVSSGQDSLDTRNRFNYTIQRTIQPIKVDGVIDNLWEKFDTASPFYNHTPTDMGFSELKTEVKITYDDKFIFVLGICHDKGKRVVQTLQRDNTGYYRSDHLTFAIDPIGNKQNGFMFGVNAGGAQFEGSLSLDGTSVENAIVWDNKWYSKVKEYDDYWVVEYAIPFRTLRYNSKNRNWGVGFVRPDIQNNKLTTWTEFPRNFGADDMNYMGTLHWKEDVPNNGRPFSVIPYSTVSSVREFNDSEQTSANKDFKVGLDAKLNITSSLNLDVTINPDFSNADVDQQVTNLTRFNIFLPERRNFFLENNDIFSNFGGWGIEPFFSRRIGLNNGQIVPIDYGMRITGNLAKKTRIGALHIRTEGYESLEAQNFTVGAVQQQVLDKSVVKALVIDKQEAGNGANSYSRNLGLEFAYVGKNGKFNNTFRLHSSHTDEQLDDNFYYGFNGNYNTRRIRSGWTFDVVGENYITEVGINPRLENYNAETDELVRIGFIKFNPYFRYLFYPKKEESVLNWHGSRTWHVVHFNHDGSLNETENNLAYDFSFKNTASLTADVRYRQINLPLPTSFLGDFTPLPVSNYTFTQFGLEYSTDNRKQIRGDIRTSYGEFFNGHRFNLLLNGNIRIQPWGNFGLSYNYNNVKLPADFGEREIHLLRFNSNISFSTNMFLTGVAQYNTQSDNFSVFSRFQWRYLPMSDLFLIYTDNYNTINGLQPNNRGFVLKLTYWF